MALFYAIAKRAGFTRVESKLIMGLNWAAGWAEGWAAVVGGRFWRRTGKRRPPPTAPDRKPCLVRTRARRRRDTHAPATCQPTTTNPPTSRETSQKTKRHGAAYLAAVVGRCQNTRERYIMPWWQRWRPLPSRVHTHSALFRRELRCTPGLQAPTHNKPR